MCVPAFAVLAASEFALKAGSALVQHNAQNQAADANKASAERSFNTTFSALGNRESQEEAATAQTIMGTDRQARAADAIARVQSGSAGIGGASIDAILQDIERQRLEFKGTEQKNLAMTHDQLELDKQVGKDTMNNRIASVRPGNPFVTGLQIAGAGLDLAGTLHRSMSPQVG